MLNSRAGRINAEQNSPLAIAVHPGEPLTCSVFYRSRGSPPEIHRLTHTVGGATSKPEKLDIPHGVSSIDATVTDSKVCVFYVHQDHGVLRKDLDLTLGSTSLDSRSERVEGY